MAVEERSCHYFRCRSKRGTVTSPFLRCSQCKVVWYCSKECQRRDWKRQHRQVCRVLAAQAELSSGVTTLSLEQMQQEYYQAIDAIKAVQKEEKENENVKNSDVSANLTKQKQKTNESKQNAGGVVPFQAKFLTEVVAAAAAAAAATHVQPLETVASKTTTQTSWDQVIMASDKDDSKAGIQTNSNRHDNSINDSCNSNLCRPFFLLQDMPHLSCFQLYLRLKVTESMMRKMTTLEAPPFSVEGGAANPNRSENNSNMQLQLSLKRPTQTSEQPSSMSPLTVLILSNHAQEDDSSCAHLLQIPFWKDLIDLPETQQRQSLTSLSTNENSHSERIFETTLRLPYHTKSRDNSSQMTTTHHKLMIKSPKVAASLCCRFCNQALMKSTPENGDNDPSGSGSSKSSSSNIPAKITRVSLLPSGHYFGQHGYFNDSDDEDDDMLDYIMCYPGQVFQPPVPPVINQDQQVEANRRRLELQRVLWEDESMAVLSANVVEDTAVCVVAWAGYGEVDSESSENQPTATRATIEPDEDDPNHQNKVKSVNDPVNQQSTSAVVRGRRPWRDSVGGATLTCSRCASVLGFAPDPETRRLLKHRIAWSWGPSESSGWQGTGDRVQERAPLANRATNLASAVPDGVYGPLPTIATFVAHQMIRYADTKAIFTFAIYSDDTDWQHSNSTTVLVLRLLRWNVPATTSDYCDFTMEDGATENGKQRGGGMICQPQWRNMAQILFEETQVDLPRHATRGNQPMQWTWANDWCCLAPSSTPPPVTKSSSPATTLSESVHNNNNNNTRMDWNAGRSLVELYLPNSEYHELWQILQHSSQYFSPSVKEATILSQMDPTMREHAMVRCDVGAIFL